MNSTADNINILAKFCGKRDLNRLTEEELFKKYKINQADIMVLFGGSIICGGDVLANGIMNRIAKKYIIVGGAGHTTESLKKSVNEKYPEILTESRTESEIFQMYLEKKYNLKADFLECRSTNCGNNITFLLQLIKEESLECKSAILVQDATMQYRMEAGLRKYCDYMEIINYAAYSVTVIEKSGKLAFKEDIPGMWNMERYIGLLMGEISRLGDDEKGYGPKGKDYIVHIDIPDKVKKAFSELEQKYGSLIRKADPVFASGK